MSQNSSKNNLKIFFIKLIAITFSIIIIINITYNLIFAEKFENIKNIQDKNEKEKLAYESLVSLATTSRIKKNKKDNKKRRYGPRYSNSKADLVSILLIGLVAAAIEENKKNNPEQNIQIQLTIEEKALDNFLNQIPIL